MIEAGEPLVSSREFRFLEGLRIHPRKSFSGRVRGERLTKKKGISIEFSDYRDYAEGDDLRHLDWNVLARLESPMMKTYRDEEDLAVHVLLDDSASMAFGDPTKVQAAAKLACALGFIGVAGGDAVYPRSIGVREQPMAGLRGRSSYARLSAWAQAGIDRSLAAGDLAIPQRSHSLAANLKAFAGSSGRAGVVVLLSDGMDPDTPGAVRALAGRGHELLFVHILSDIELDPDLEGDLRLLDAESGAPVEITANSYTMREYRDRLAAHNEALAEAARRGGGRYALVRAGQPLDDVVRNTLKREGWVR